jgi:polysaccharide pyruvyl transferase WcaK-like protein
VPNDYFTPQQMLSLIGCCRLTMSSRYHFCLFSALQGVPFLALERSDKVADLCWDLQWTLRMGLKDLSAERVGQLGRDLLRQASSHSRLLTDRTERMRNRARTNHVALAAVSRN